ncbi:MAG: hypothetical protein IJI10_01655, partial [Eubacterium sp.]|nr:hypothetical protein [Eubacterium sp.]
MSIEQIGKANAGDQPQLHRLWESVFGDPPELVQAFFDRFPPEASGWVVRQGDRICSAAYLLPGNWRNIRLRLIIIVVADKILDGVFGEKLF